jgi:L-gulonolactone oxidase
VERIPFGSIEEFFTLAENSNSAEHTVAWIDCAGRGSSLGRGIFQRADWTTTGDLVAHDDRFKLTVPIEAPNAMLNGQTVRVFNALYYWLQRKGERRRTMHYAQFFYPLDAILHWNKLYGRSGLYQYQCVMPPGSAKAAVKALLDETAKAGAGSFLAVLKTLGPRESVGMLSFPREGATLALDFPQRGEPTLALLSRLDSVVRESGGRLYPAKDGRMSAGMFRNGYPRLSEFLPNVDRAFCSDFWKRVMG